MRTSDMIKSKFWRAIDVQGRPPVRLTISAVTEELFTRGGRNEVKYFLWFLESEKGLQLNKTRVTLLETAYGPDSDGWSGGKVRLSYDPTVMFGGRAVGGVKLETPSGVLYSGPAAGWGAPAAAAPPVPGRPPPPVWDEQRQAYVMPAPAPATGAGGTAPAALRRPPAPVWNEATQQYEVVNPGTGEIHGANGSAPAARPATISERVNARHPAAGSDDGWGTVAPTGAPAARADFDDETPF